MGVFTRTDEYTSPIPPDRLFKALVLDAHILIPELMPEAVKSIDNLKGDGRAGSIKKINYVEGSQLKSVINRVDDVDEENFVYAYTLVEGEPLVVEKLEYITYKAKFEAASDGGSKNRLVSNYYTKGDVVLKEEDIKAGRERALGMYRVVEAYLLQNPDAYA